MEYLTELFQAYNEYAKTNPVIAGVMSLWGMGVITFAVRNVPLRIFSFLQEELTTCLTLTSQSTGTNQQTFASFLVWFEKSRWVRFSRSVSLNGAGNWWENGSNRTVVGIGNGSHFFVYKGRPCWMNRITMSGTTNEVTYEVKIRMLGRNRKLIQELIEEFIYKPDPEKTGIYTREGKDWTRVTDIPRRTMKTIVLDQVIKTKLLRDIETFRKSRDWYEERGLPYKLTLMLHGIPGSGKSTLIKALASHFEMNLAIVRLVSMSDTALENALATAPKNCLIVMEDCDSAKATHIREGMKPAAESNVLTAVLDGGWLSLSGLLNALDGVVAIDGSIIILTTNVIETLDPALLRAGRVDHVIELGKLTDVEVREYIQLMYPDSAVSTHLHFHPIAGCDLQKLYLAQRDNLDNFIAAIPHAIEESRVVEGVFGKQKHLSTIV